MNKRDRDILRNLAREIAEIGHLPIQEEKKRLWRKLNGLRPERPMVMIDQVCWHEMNVDDELTLQCEDPEARTYENGFRRILYQWRHFPVDSVVEPVVWVHKAITVTGFGIRVQEHTLETDPLNPVVSHSYVNQLEQDEDIEKIKMPRVFHDKAETERRLALAHELFDGILEVVAYGYDPAYFSVWDPISMWMGVENLYVALMERPAFMRELACRVVTGYHAMLDQLEQQHLLCHYQPVIHCTGAWTDDLPAPGYDPRKPRTRDLWAFGLAQPFGSVSPEMFEMWEIDLSMPVFERFGLIYYGCCDPLHQKVPAVRRIPNVRKISMSPWVDQEQGAEAIGRDYVFSRKPNPALLAGDAFSEEAIRADLQRTVEICQRHGCPLEIILKDISTVRYEPRRLWRWAEIAMEVVDA